MSEQQSRLQLLEDAIAECWKILDDNDWWDIQEKYDAIVDVLGTLPDAKEASDV